MQPTIFTRVDAEQYVILATCSPQSLRVQDLSHTLLPMAYDTKEAQALHAGDVTIYVGVSDMLIMRKIAWDALPEERRTRIYAHCQAPA